MVLFSGRQKEEELSLDKILYNIEESPVFPAHHYNHDTRRIIAFWEKMVQESHRGESRKTGGPYYTGHIIPAAELLFIAARDVSQSLGHTFIVPTGDVITVLGHDKWENDKITNLMLDTTWLSKTETERYYNMLEVRGRRDEAKSGDIQSLTDFANTIVPMKSHVYVPELVRGVKNIREMTRKSEEVFYNEYVYHMHQPREDYSLEDVLTTSCGKAADRTRNTEDTVQRFTPRQARQLQEQYNDSPRLKERYGNVSFLGRDHSRSEVFHTCFRSFLLLNAMNANLLHKYGRFIESDKYQGNRDYLYLLINLKGRLIEAVKTRLTQVYESFTEDEIVRPDQQQEKQGYIDMHIRNGVFDRVTGPSPEMIHYPMTGWETVKKLLKEAYGYGKAFLSRRPRKDTEVSRLLRDSTLNMVTRWYHNDVKKRLVRAGGKLRSYQEDYDGTRQGQIMLYSDTCDLLTLMDMFIRTDQRERASGVPFNNRFYNRPERHQYFYVTGVTEGLRSSIKARPGMEYFLEGRL